MESSPKLMKNITLGLMVAGMFVVTGCETTKPLYHWGSYPALTYLQYTKPDKATAEFQIEKLNEDLEKAAAKNLDVPPGLHAHLGYIYLQSGRIDEGMEHLQIEKRRFPESAQMIDGMIENLSRKEAP